MSPNEPAPMYAPLATRQNPAKKRNTKAPGNRPMAAIAQSASGSTMPNTGPAQTTARGFGFRAQVRSGNGQRVQHDPGHLATGQPGSEHMAHFIDGQHAQPGAEKGGENQNCLVPAYHRVAI